jgi:UPF0042 nucleotide-binding protein
VIVTGLSGSGKTHALRALEDLGYFCIDNLPTQLIPTLAELAGRDDRQLDKVALVIDIREGPSCGSSRPCFRRLQTHPRTRPFLIYLEASHSSLVRRFSETRRPHPLAPDRSVSEGIRDEQEKMAAIRALADMTVDTSKLTVHELRDIFMRMSREGQGARAEMVVTLLSFGFKNGLPEDADLVFDVRCLPNPHFVERLRPLTGRDQPVVRFMRRSPETRAFIAQLASFLTFSLPQYVREGKTYLTCGDRLHGRPPPVGHDRGGPETRAARRARGPPAREAPRFLRASVREPIQESHACPRHTFQPGSRNRGATSSTGPRPTGMSERSCTSRRVTP